MAGQDLLTDADMNHVSPYSLAELAKSVNRADAILISCGALW
ncbi:MAG TPA: hypothetical protein VNS34_28080 [Rhizobiaceae bacterium]|nr:hypothetical protein [Rhizobiaceae bacterium]